MDNSSHATAQGQAAMDDAAEAVQGGLDQIRSRAGQAADSISRYTRDNPGMALLIAAATGAALLALLRAVTPSSD